MCYFILSMLLLFSYYKNRIYWKKIKSKSCICYAIFFFLIFNINFFFY